MDEPQITQSDAELRSHVQRVLSPTYELDREIGRGGMGIVYRARDARLKRPVAIKLLPPELAFRSEIRSRFLREAETAAQLSHPNIVPIYSVDEKDGLVYFVMAFVDGDNLAKRIHDQGALGSTEARRILRDVADALAYAHGHGVVHRDIKPDNILLDSQNGRPMVTDFGIARAISDGDARLTATGIAIGTPAFMSPEQSAGDRDLDGRSDLYSLGVVAYQMLCGDLPFNANSTPALLVKHLSERPVPIEQRSGDVPADLARAVMLCLEKNPDDRFPSAQALVTALESGDVPALPAVRPQAPEPIATYSATTGYGGGTQDPVADYVPTTDDRSRWEAPEVVLFRKRLYPFIAVGSVSVLMAILNISSGFLGIVSLWAVYVAYRYARLWSDGYSWHDVFRQPRDRLFLDVVSELFDNVQALWNSQKRVEVRERHRRRIGAPSMFSPSSGTAAPRLLTAADAGALGTGPFAARARQALVDRDEISRLVLSLPRGEQQRVVDVPQTASKLAESVVTLAQTLRELERGGSASSADAIDKEIAVLESQANPLDRAASEERVRRLATLKRQRRTVAELLRRRDGYAGKLEECALALQNIRFEMLRLKTGSQSWQQVTSVAEQALALARDVDEAVYVADELSRISARPGDARRPSSGRP
ncbi:MAG: protein kinase [Gemmatimonadetes bacterium]|nr:protein kinase [Gemmatimonadota bacterium]